MPLKQAESGECVIDGKVTVEYNTTNPFYQGQRGEKKMKRKIAVILCTAALTAAMVTGCGGSTSTKETKDSVEASEMAEETAENASEGENTEAEAAETSSEDIQAETDAAGTVLADGVYSAEFDTDNSMFRVNEANEGKGVLTVENGKMTIHVSLVSKNIVNLFVGTAEEAKKDGAEILEPSTDTVTYSDGMSEEVYGFDIPVPALDEEFDVALIGTKGKWYDHKVSVSNPQPQ